jgi:hypothetical protein
MGGAGGEGGSAGRMGGAGGEGGSAGRIGGAGGEGGSMLNIREVSIELRLRYPQGRKIGFSNVKKWLFFGQKTDIF